MSPHETRTWPAHLRSARQPPSGRIASHPVVRSPIADDGAFTDLLAKHRVLVLPGTVVEVPGWLRISLTASDEMVDRGIPGFAAAYAEAVRG